MLVERKQKRLEVYVMEGNLGSECLCLVVNRWRMERIKSRSGGELCIYSFNGDLFEQVATLRWLLGECDFAILRHPTDIIDYALPTSAPYADLRMVLTKQTGLDFSG